MQMTTAPQETCSHERCDMEPCTYFDDMTYERDEVWGWGTACDRCDRVLTGMLPEEHYERAHHDEDAQRAEEAKVF